MGAESRGSYDHVEKGHRRGAVSKEASSEELDKDDVSFEGRLRGSGVWSDGAFVRKLGSSQRADICGCPITMNQEGGMMSALLGFMVEQQK